MQKKVAVISGGASGIGRAAVFRFLEEGYFPVILDRNADAAAETLAAIAERKLEGQFIQADLTKKQEVQSAFQQILDTHGQIDVLTAISDQLSAVSQTKWARTLS